MTTPAGLLDRLRPASGAPPAWSAGVRASLLTTTPVAVAVLLGRPLWFWMAIGAWLVTLGDTGAAYSTRARAMLSITALGGLACALLGGVALVLHPLAGVMLVAGFAFSMLRAVGEVASVVGGMLVVVTVIVLGAPTSEAAAVGERAAMFVAGGLASTATLLASWRIHPYNPARAAVATSLDALADAATELAGLVQRPAEKTEWDGFVGAFHRRVRAALESAQAAVVATRLSRADTPVTDRLELLLQQEDRIFEALVALAEALEVEALGGAVAVEAAPSLRHIAAALTGLAGATRERGAGVDAREHAAPPVAHAPASTLVGTILRSIHAALDVAVVAPRPVGAFLTDAPGVRAFGRALLGVRTHLTARSHAFVHAARVAGASALAMLLVESLHVRHGSWAVLTTAVCLQPSNAGTWSRALERIVGTVVGAAAAALIAHFAPFPATVIVVFAVATFAAVALKPLGYLYFVVFLTPPFALFAELGQRVGSALGDRVLDTLLGGALAIVTVTVFFRRADARRLRVEVAEALEGERALLARIVERRAGASQRAVHAVREARRRVGLANNNAEDTLKELASARGADRALQERLGAVLAYGRRLVATMLALAEVGRGDGGELDAEDHAAVARVDAMLDHCIVVLRGRAAPPIAPSSPHPPSTPTGLRRMEWLARSMVALLDDRAPDGLPGAGVSVSSPTAGEDSPPTHR